MLATDVIKAPIVTEKSTFAMNEANRYTFEVDVRSSKTQIKDAVESLFGVKVLGVSTQIRESAIKRNRFGWVPPKKRKIAIVRPAEESRIELF